MRPQLSQAHFQLTGRCNLSCRFCGQSKGMLTAAAEELSAQKWLSLAEELKTMAAEAGRIPEITLWGGEPLLSPFFDELAEALHKRGFRLNVVTNATLLHHHLSAVAAWINHIYVSVDGTRRDHDAVRGEGVFDLVRENLRLLAGVRRGRLTLLTTISDQNVQGISRLPLELAELHPDSIILQPLMYLRQQEITAYRNYSRRHFQADYPELCAWHREEDTGYLATLKRELDIIRKTSYPFPVIYTPHHYPDTEKACSCSAPWRRVHIRHDGAVGFCTDYFSFSAGNVQNRSLREIFYGKQAEEFRRAIQGGHLPICDHCPWRKQTL